MAPMSIYIAYFTKVTFGVLFLFVFAPYVGMTISKIAMMTHTCRPVLFVCSLDEGKVSCPAWVGSDLKGLVPP